jgi:AP2 domain
MTERLYGDWFPKKPNHNGKIQNQIRTFRENEILYLEMKLKDNKTMLFDTEDLKYVKNFKWRLIKSGYIYYSTNNKDKRFHRLIHPEWKIIDHINRNGLDNRRFNLRDGSNGVNEKNCKLRKNNTSGINGLNYDKESKRWQFEWRENGKRKKKNFYGAYDDEEVKQRAFEFKQQIDQRINNQNGY